MKVSPWPEIPDMVYCLTRCCESQNLTDLKDRLSMLTDVAGSKTKSGLVQVIFIQPAFYLYLASSIVK